MTGIYNYCKACIFHILAYTYSLIEIEVYPPLNTIKVFSSDYTLGVLND